MPALPISSPVAVVGAGTMGSGIAMVAAAAGHTVLLFDVREAAARAARDLITGQLDRWIAKGRISEDDRDRFLQRIVPCDAIGDLAGAGLAIEAVVEDLGVKLRVFDALEAILGDHAFLATNTSSLSITAIAAGLRRPGRLIGMHFFNPVPVMALVEIVSGLETDPKFAQRAFDTAAAWGKSPVHVRSTPGFLVNRVARPFYGEALRIIGEQGAEPETIDAVMREAGGFRMGPFELMDMIGHDVNYTVTCSIFDAYYEDPRYRPSLIQKELVEAGFLGRKTMRGFFDHFEGAERPPPATAEPVAEPTAVVIEGDLGPAEGLARAIENSALPSRREPADGDGRIVVDGAVLKLTDGRTATERAAAEATDDLVLFDLALDYDNARRIAMALPDQGTQKAADAGCGLFQALGMAVSVIDDVPGLLVMRTVAMLANEGADAVLAGIADAAGVDTAMEKGVNYPIGPLAWGDQIGAARVLGVLDNLARTYGEDRYRASALLRRRAAAQETLRD